tara:strand:- start:335 stop:2104 length:1770 start_codon:yes stop_codon:yes gene_type:complete
VNGCAYFNTFYNAQNYYEEAEKLRLQKEGKSIPISAIDKYGKTIQKCQKVLKEYPESKFRIDAILLMSKAWFYRQDYDLALENLKIVVDEGTDIQTEEANYWRAICKWKKGNSQSGINELTTLLERSTSKDIQSKCHLSLAEILNELKNYETALAHLEAGARLTKNRAQKGVIYGQLAEMAFNKERYDLAQEAYENVISNSLSKEKIEMAYLQILKIHRVRQEYRLATRKIKGMLTDDKFNGIAGNLELELVQLYKVQGNVSEIETRLESIVSEYQRTLVSAEAYYLLGQVYISEKWDLKKSKEYFDQVSKESSKSLFSPMAKTRSKAIDIYMETEKDIEQHLAIVDIDTAILVNTSELDSTIEESIDELDSTVLVEIVDTDLMNKSVSIMVPDRSIPELYYQLADLEAFNFNRIAQGIDLLNKIISEYPDSPFHPKSIFTLAFMYESMGDSLRAEKTRKSLLDAYPNSEYASYISSGVLVALKEQEKKYSEAELQISLHPEKAITLFKEVIQLDEKDEMAVSAAYTLGYHYDNSTQLDSALKYYNWIVENHPNSLQFRHANERIQTLQYVLSSMNETTIDSTILQDEN